MSLARVKVILLHEQLISYERDLCLERSLLILYISLPKNSMQTDPTWALYPKIRTILFLLLFATTVLYEQDRTL